MRTSICVLLAAAFCGAAIAQTVENYRLDHNVLPSNYDINLTPYITAETGDKQFTFDGTARITLATALSTQASITLHAAFLTIRTATLREADIFSTTEISIISQALNNVTDKLTLNLASPLRPNINYVLTFEYSGILHTDMRGFYRSSYVENNQTVWLATTQMQPTHARKVFPSFDEPSFKATFDVTINRPANYSPTISNTRIQTTAINGELVSEKFFQTPIMSTYLLAFIVSQFRTRSNADGSFGVVARPGAYDQTEYAFNIGTPLLQSLEEYTNYSYTSVPGITKMQMAALPDFSAGAMENWGLLTYRETYLLYDPLETTDLAQQRVAYVITHEQAHMWFGDLVTCEWWNLTWLNEGFARYFQYFGTHWVEPSWEMDSQFVVEQLQAVLLVDSQETTHPMSFEVNSPAEVSAIFDNISYNKGASVLRMVEHLIGADNFRDALREYLVENQFNTSTPEKLYSALQRHAPTVPLQVNITTFLNGWTTQSGYPVVTIDRLNTTHVTVSQQRFLLNQRHHSDATRWQIPLTFATLENPNFAATAPRVVLSNTDASTTIQLDAARSWTIFNLQQTGYYRVNYDTASWEAIKVALKADQHSNIHELNRAQIVDDILNLARADYVNYTLALDILQYLEGENHYLPWLSALTGLNYVSLRLSADNLTLYQNHIINTSKNVYTKLGFNAISTDTRLDTYNRAQILGIVCKYGNADCVAASQTEFAKINNTYSVPPNIRPVVYCAVVASETPGAFELLWNRFLSTNLASEQVVILTALGCTKDSTKLTTYMNYIVSTEVRLQDKATAFSATYSQQSENVDTVLDYVILNHQRIATAFESTTNVETILSGLASRFTSLEQIEKLINFSAATAQYRVSGTITRAVETARFNLAWSESHVPTIVKFIEDYNGAGQMVSAVLLVTLAALFALFH